MQLERYAPSALPVLIVGPTGSGKELFAQHIHRLSGRRGELVDVNCGALPADMVESLLFGHRRGAFTGALADGVGLVSHAAGGTLFLDELTSLPLMGQAKLLRLLDTGEVRRLGDTAKRRIDFRLVAAAQDDLAGRVQRGRFRADLYHRVRALRIDIPGLASRPEDIVLLAQYFAHLHGRTVAAAAMPLLLGYGWPGNVRELRWLIERSVILTDHMTLSPVVIEEALHEGCDLVESNPWVPGASGNHLRQRLIEICAEHGWNRERVAEALNISVATLYRRLKVAGLSLREFSQSSNGTSSAIDEKGSSLIHPT
jgi:transcriptional regulator with PAS, ATPase and Fis domain